eukprot:m.72827 g.72827  ORF g.72827 m.72827 type:complete len:66 (+) comp35818_c0_seq4:1603-1800(+)
MNEWNIKLTQAQINRIAFQAPRLAAGSPSIVEERRSHYDSMKSCSLFCKIFACSTRCARDLRFDC